MENLHDTPLVVLFYKHANLFMQIRTLKAGEYRGCKIYYRNYGNTFEYLAVIDGAIYTMHATIRRTPLQALLGRDYSEKQLLDVVNYLAPYAEATVDYKLDEATK